MKHILLLLFTFITLIGYSQKKPITHRQGAKFPLAVKNTSDTIPTMDGDKTISGYRLISELPSVNVIDGFESTSNIDAGSAFNDRKLYHKAIETSNAITALSRSFLNNINTTISNDYSDLHTTIYSGSGSLGANYFFIQKTDNTYRFIQVVDSNSVKNYNDFDAENTLIRGTSTLSLTPNVPSDNFLTKEFFEILITTLETRLSVDNRFYYKIYNVYQPNGIDFFNTTTATNQYYFNYWHRQIGSNSNQNDLAFTANRNTTTLTLADKDSIVNIAGNPGTIYQLTPNDYNGTFDLGDVITIRQADSAYIKISYDDGDLNGYQKSLKTYERGDIAAFYKTGASTWDILKKPSYKPYQQSISPFIGNNYAVELDNPSGNYYNMSGAAANGNFNLGANLVLGAFSKIRINQATIPAISLSNLVSYPITQIQGATFQANTDMYLVIDFNGSEIQWYLLQL